MKIGNLENGQRKYIKTLGNFHVIECSRRGGPPANATEAYFMGKLNLKSRQVLIEISQDHPAAVRSGTIQWIGGSVEIRSDIKGFGDLMDRIVYGQVVKEAEDKTAYFGEGCIALVPTPKNIILQDISQWGTLGMTTDDRHFLACDAHIKRSKSIRQYMAFPGENEGFHISLTGNGVAALESAIPEEDLVEIELEKEELQIAADLPVCWSSGLTLTVSKTSGRFAGTVPIYKYSGTGKILVSLQAAEPPKTSEKKPFWNRKKEEKDDSKKGEKKP